MVGRLGGEDTFEPRIWDLLLSYVINAVGELIGRQLVNGDSMFGKPVVLRLQDTKYKACKYKAYSLSAVRGRATGNPATAGLPFPVSTSFSTRSKEA